MSIASLIDEFGGMIRQAMHYVTSADKAYQWLRSQEIEISRSIVRKVWKAVGEKERWETVIQTWGIEKPIPRAWVIERESKESDVLLHYVKSTWYNPDTGEWKDVEHSYRVDDVTAFMDFMDDVYDQESDYAEMEGYKLVSIADAGYERLRPKRE